MIVDYTGQQFGNYRLTRRLGQGAFASVYLGQHIRISTQRAAIKILHLIDVDINKFQQEAETTATLVHPNIVRLFDFDLRNDVPFLVMDYAPSGSLFARHARGTRVPLATIAQYAEQIARALQYAHNKNVIHRDVKPENILVGPNDELLLGDFGIAVISRTGRTTLQASFGTGGTPLYMAPEMFKGRPEKASDQYSLAIMVYQWLSGDPPFTEGDAIQLGFQHTFVDPLPLREKVASIPLAAETVVMKALAKDARSRYSSIEEFASLLSSALTNSAKLTPSPESNRPRVQLGQSPADTSNTKSDKQWFNEAETARQAKRYEEAIKAYTHALDLNPNYALAYHNRGLAYYELRQFSNALADYGRAIAISPRAATYYINRGNVYHNELKDYEKALADYTKAIDLEPDDAFAYNHRGNTYCALKQYNKALTDLNRAIALDARFALAYSNRGLVYYELKDYTHALSDYQHALQLEPKDAFAWNGCGLVYYELKQYEKALEHYNKAIEINANSAAYYLNRGNVYHNQLKQYEKALADYGRAVELEPRYALAYNHRGNTYNSLKQYEKALADLNQALILDPNLSFAYGNRAYALEMRKEYQRALQDYERALQLDPANTWARESRDRVARLIKK